MGKNNHRKVTIQRHFTKHSPGSVLVSFGDTMVLCTASIDEKVPRFMRGEGKGWLTADYALLPGSTQPRAQREVHRGKQSGRTSEIQRLIGRTLRSILDFELLGERTIMIDADVLQADGGTRTAAITGSMVAVYDAVMSLMDSGQLDRSPIKEWLAAVSVGIVDDEVVCDLCYDEDSQAEVDMNVVMTQSGRFVEVQGTAEGEPFTQDQLSSMLSIAEKTIQKLIQQIQKSVK